jgi:NADH-quinone oxidoreductase subunit C
MSANVTGSGQPSLPLSPATTVTAVPEAAVFDPLPGPDLLVRTAFPFQPVDFSSKGYHLEATVSSDQVVNVAAELDREGLALDTITGVDWPAEAKMEIVYDYFHPLTGLRLVVRSRVPRDIPEISTISEIFPGANWHERETHDFFGIYFQGHPNLSPFLLPEDATYHPLRKDFTSCS